MSEDNIFHNKLYGTLEFEGTEITLMQSPYCDMVFRHNRPQEIMYVAKGEDEEGNEYEITWPIINHETEDESEACDWEDFRVLIKG